MIVFRWIMLVFLDWRKLGMGTYCLGTPITEQRLKVACNKSPGRDDISLVFFKVNWDGIKDDMPTLFNQMNFDIRIMEIQKHGKVVSIHKTEIPITPADYKPTTWRIVPCSLDSLV